MISEILKATAVADPNQPARSAGSVWFRINNTKLCMAVTMSINSNIKCLENLKQGF